MRRIALLVLLAGCPSFKSPSGTEADASPPGDDGGLCEAWATRGGHVQDLCAMEPAGSWSIGLGGATYDTTNGTVSGGVQPRSFLVSQPDARMLRVVSVDRFDIEQGATLRVIGSYSLLVLSWSTITIDGTIDVSSTAGSVGAGGSRPDCDNGDPGQGAMDAGGGGGGGFGQGGANGGTGSVGGPGPDNLGGTPGGSSPRPRGVVLGGCRGGIGGGAGGQGGDGGGAVQLTARTSITIASMGRIHAGGAGGGGAQGNGGGGGAGAGGYIGLDAPEVTTLAGSVLAANGGGGGAGCDSGSGAPGQDGLDVNMAAVGGSGTSCLNGASGGNGGRRGDAATPGTDSSSSGGGGGGGAGYIVIWAPSISMVSGVRSPAEIHVPDPE